MANPSRIKTAALTLLIALLFAGALQAQNAQKKPARDPLLRMVPAESLFCVRVNNFKASLTLMESFLQGLAPVPLKLTKFLDDEKWQSVQKDGDFALFGVLLPADPPSANPLANLFVGLLVPVPEYDKLIRGNPDISEADANGISKVGGESGRGPLIIKAGKYALLCWRKDYDKLVKAKSLVTAENPGLRAALDAQEIERAATRPIWAYANIQLVGKTFGPVVIRELDQAKKMFEKMEEQQKSPMTNPSAIMDMYAAILKVLADEVQYVTVALDPNTDVLNVSQTVAAREGTKLADAFVAGARTKGQRDKLLPYLEDGATMNFSGRVNVPFLENTYVRSLDLLTCLGGGMSQQDIDKLKALMLDEFAAAGENLAFSFTTGQDKPPFAMKYIAEISDQEKFNKVVDQQIEMISSGAFADIYKNLGMKMDFTVKRGASKYSEVSIDSAKLVIRSTDPDSQQGKMIEAMYGDGFEYRWAVVDGHAVYVVGGDVDAGIRTLIDQVRAGGPKKLGAEMKTAITLLGKRGSNDFVGTFNYVRFLNMIASMMQGLPTPGPAMSPIDMKSRSNVAFAGGVAKGKLTARAAIPKEHLTELVTAFGMMQQKMTEQRQKARSEGDKTGFKPLFNGKDLAGWEPTGNAKWTVVDGMLVGTQGENNAPGDLFTKQSFKDFELTCTYRAEWPCNSGIWFRYQSPEKAYQADILEWKDPVCYSGTVYCPGKMFIAMNTDKSLVNRDGWNTMKVRAEGDHLQVWLNGRQVADVHDSTTDSGKIGFQVHPGAEFGPMKIIVKEILIKQL
jgi:hypothetical protein